MIIPDRAEFIDTLRQMQRGAVIARAAGASEAVVLNGRPLPSAFGPLTEYQLLEEVKPDGEPTAIRFYRLNARGREFAERAWAEWKRRPLLERIAARLLG